MSAEPNWTSDDPQRWSTYWQAWYQIAGAKAVMVKDYLHTEKEAKATADKALEEALKKVSDLGLKVEASCWTVKWRSRTQTQRFDAENTIEYVTADWYGRICQVLKAIWEQERSEHTAATPQRHEPDAGR